MALQLYNSRTRQLEPFVSIEEGLVKFYCCGPTVYNFAHLGNLRTYIFEDLLRRTFLALGWKVKHVMNVTDVGHLSDDGDDGEDKIIKAARQKKMSVWDIAQYYTDTFFEDCKKLNILRPEVVCKATDHIQEMIDLIKKLEQNGLTYQAGGNVYYEVSKFERYNELARLDKQELRDGARIEVDEHKKNPRDFALWFTNSKFSDQAMLWDSPWGRGYPGWHIECSAMSTQYLGEHFDVHCGGVDHINVHHTNEIAQTEGAYGNHPWVNYWMHAEFLLLDSSKMSKSSGQFLTVDRLAEAGFEPLDFRYFCLGASYRTQLNYSDEAMQAAKNARKRLIDRLYTIYASLMSNYSDNNLIDPLLSITLDNPRLLRFVDAISDDLNMPQAIACVWETLKSDLDASEKLSVILEMDKVLGLSLLTCLRERKNNQVNKAIANNDNDKDRILALIEERIQARANKNFLRSDEIRDLLKAEGIILVDTAGGTTWSKAN